MRNGKIFGYLLETPRIAGEGTLEATGAGEGDNCRQLFHKRIVDWQIV
jgi:hypothetical protein